MSDKKTSEDQRSRKGGEREGDPRKKRLAEALRRNLRQRKQAASPAPKDGDKGAGK